MSKQAKRETATEQVRIYPSTHKRLQELSEDSGKRIARIISEAFKI